MSDIVGGLMRELSQSHAVVDEHARQTLATYEKDPVLSQLPVPRLAIRQATVKLRFVINAQQTAVEDDDPDEYRAIWSKSVQERILPELLEKVGKLDNKAVVLSLSGRLSQPEVTTRITAGALLDERSSATLHKQTVDAVMAEVRSLPKSVQRYLPAEDQLLKATEEAVALELPSLQKATRNLQDIRRATLSGLDVAVTPREIGETPEAIISELELTIGMDELQRGGS